MFKLENATGVSKKYLDGNQLIEINTKQFIVMPVIKCSNGKYRIGTGKCIYKTNAAAERAYRAYLAKKKS